MVATPQRESPRSHAAPEAILNKNVISLQKSEAELQRKLVNTV